MYFDIRQLLSQMRYTFRWIRAGYGAPYPHYMKQATLLRHSTPGAVFIETGTYRGSTSRYFANRGFKVVTVEVHKPLYDRFSPGLKRLGIDARLGDSSDLMAAILIDYASSPDFSIFLDGHYSGGMTGQGVAEVPVVKEFTVIAEFIKAHPEKNFSVMVDDIRLFMPDGDPSYPLTNSLIEFSESVSADWKFQNDIFIVTSRRVGYSGS